MMTDKQSQSVRDDYERDDIASEAWLRGVEEDRKVRQQQQNQPPKPQK